MKQRTMAAAAAALVLAVGGLTWSQATRPAEAQSRNRGRTEAQNRSGERDRVQGYYNNLDKKIVPILTVGSSISVGAAQVAGESRDVNRVKAVAQIETDYKDAARIKILVPVESEGIIKNIDRVPGVSVIAAADYAIKK